MLIDELMPRFDFSERHRTRIDSSSERVYDAIRTADLSRNVVVRLLLTLRGMGSAKRRTLANFDGGFTVIGENPPREIVIGVQGPFWHPRCRLHDITAATFREPVPGGVARAAWNFFIDDETLSTETRILCAADARAKFRVYWFFIRPFSGLIRRMMLSAIRDEAER